MVKKIAIGLVVFIALYYLWYTYSGTHKCNCQNGESDPSKCTCGDNKNALERWFSKINSKLSQSSVSGNHVEGETQSFEGNLETLLPPTDMVLQDAAEENRDALDYTIDMENKAKSEEHAAYVISVLTPILSKVKKDLHDQEILIKNIIKDDKMDNDNKMEISNNISAKIEKYNNQIYLLEKTIKHAEINQLDKLDYSVFWLKNGKSNMTGEGAKLVIDRHADENGVQHLVIAKKRDALNLAQVVQAPNIVDLYYKDFAYRLPDYANVPM